MEGAREEPFAPPSEHPPSLRGMCSMLDRARGQSQGDHVRNATLVGAKTECQRTDIEVKGSIARCQGGGGDKQRKRDGRNGSWERASTHQPSWLSGASPPTPPRSQVPYRLRGARGQPVLPP